MKDDLNAYWGWTSMVPMEGSKQFFRRRKMKQVREYKVGDLVRVRDWEDMALACRTSEAGHLQMPITGWNPLGFLVFHKDMREHCGTMHRIRKVDPLIASFKLGTIEKWNFTPCMVTLVKAVPEKEEPKKEEPKADKPTECRQSARSDALERSVGRLEKYRYGSSLYESMLREMEDMAKMRTKKLAWLAQVVVDRRKIIEAWFETDLPERYKELALSRIAEGKEPLHVESLAQAIDHGFHWAGTPEGHDFWHKLYIWSKKGVNAKLPELPKKAAAQVPVPVPGALPWFDRLPKEYQDLIQTGYRKAPSLSSAFAWDSTPEGDDFWRAVDAWLCPEPYTRPKLPAIPSKEPTKPDLKPILPRIIRHKYGHTMVAHTEEHLEMGNGAKSERYSVLNWHHWSGGEMPVKRGTWVTVYTKAEMLTTGRAEDFRWGHTRKNDDIIAYAAIEAPNLG